jgi:hypothetical protein
MNLNCRLDLTPQTPPLQVAHTFSRASSTVC